MAVSLCIQPTLDTFGGGRQRGAPLWLTLSSREKGDRRSKEGRTTARLPSTAPPLNPPLPPPLIHLDAGRSGLRATLQLTLHHSGEQRKSREEILQ